MYPWNQPGDAPPARGDGHDGPAGRPGTGAARQAARALQVALDRRDNGGESPAAGQ